MSSILRILLDCFLRALRAFSATSIWLNWFCSNFILQVIALASFQNIQSFVVNSSSIWIYSNNSIEACNAHTIVDFVEILCIILRYIILNHHLFKLIKWVCSTFESCAFFLSAAKDFRLALKRSDWRSNHRLTHWAFSRDEEFQRAKSWAWRTFVVDCIMCSLADRSNWFTIVKYCHKADFWSDFKALLCSSRTAVLNW